MWLYIYISIHISIYSQYFPHNSARFRGNFPQFRFSLQPSFPPLKRPGASQRAEATEKWHEGPQRAVFSTSRDICGCWIIWENHGLILKNNELMVVHNDESWVNDGGFRSNGGDPQWLDGWFPWENPMKIRMITFGVPPPWLRKPPDVEGCEILRW